MPCWLRSPADRQSSRRFKRVCESLFSRFRCGPPLREELDSYAHPGIHPSNPLRLADSRAPSDPARTWAFDYNGEITILVTDEMGTRLARRDYFHSLGLHR